MLTVADTSAVEQALGRIRAWGEAHDWKGYNPYDGLNSPAARFLSLDTAYGRRLVTQSVKLSPLNLRPILGIRPEWNAKAIGLVASGYGRLAAATEDAGAEAEAARFLETEMAAPGGHFRYVPNSDLLIHNANLLACSVLVRA